MTIEINDKLRAIYFASGHEQDWMAALTEDPPGCFNVVMRFRYYDPADPGNDAWSDQDRKSWCEAHGKPGAPTYEQALAGMQKVMDELQAIGFTPKGGIACKLVRGSMTPAQFFREFKKLPFVHAREELTTKENAP